jgi:histidyl-tRNA synthetase
MAKLQPVRGTRDLLPEDSRRHRAVIDTARDVAALFGYAEYSTPIFEFTEVFARTLGDTSDIVTKEMYTFTDKGGDQITLRPEATAGIARALISGGLQQALPLKVFCTGPMFRYERPQKGRLRQFHQIDVELVGVPGPLGDVEVVVLGAEVLDRLGVLSRTELQLNTLGDTDSRKAYRTALVDYFSAHMDALSEDSRERLGRNPLRILDSKDKGDRRLIEDAPLFGDYLNAESQDFFATVQEGLQALGIGFTVSPRLVRGLDYYCHTAFEFVTTELGAQGAVLAGGRYDGLVETMGGPPTPGTGWAAGIERLALMIAEPPAPPRPVAVVPIGAAATMAALRVAGALRHAGVVTELALAGNLKRGLARANKIGARAAVLIGEDELARQAATVRDLDSGTQSEVRLDDLAAHLAARP